MIKRDSSDLSNGAFRDRSWKKFRVYFPYVTARRISGDRSIKRFHATLSLIAGRRWWWILVQFRGWPTFRDFRANFAPSNFSSRVIVVVENFDNRQSNNSIVSSEFNGQQVYNGSLTFFFLLLLLLHRTIEKVVYNNFPERRFLDIKLIFPAYTWLEVSLLDISLGYTRETEFSPMLLPLCCSLSLKLFCFSPAIGTERKKRGKERGKGKETQDERDKERGNSRLNINSCIAARPS